MENFVRGDQQEWGTKKDVSLPMVVGLDSGEQGFDGIFLGEISRSGGTTMMSPCLWWLYCQVETEMITSLMSVFMSRR